MKLLFLYNVDTFISPPLPEFTSKILLTGKFYLPTRHGKYTKVGATDTTWALPKFISDPCGRLVPGKPSPSQFGKDVGEIFVFFGTRSQEDQHHVQDNNAVGKIPFSGDKRQL